MTISTSLNKVRYEGNGATDTFAFNGRVFLTADLVVEIILRSDDSLVETLTETTDYTVTINSAESASVVVGGAKIPTALQDIQIRRALPLTQTLDLPTGTRFSAVSVENAFDKITAITQDLQEQVDRKVGIPVTDSGDTPDVIGLLEDATEATAASAAAADVSATAAAASAAAAGASETAASGHADDAEAWAATATVGNIDGLTDNLIAQGDYLVYADVSDSGNAKKDRLIDAVTVCLIDEDDMATDSATRAPTQQSVKAYVDSGSAFVLLGTYTASSDTSVDIGSGLDLDAVIDATYKNYIIDIIDMVVATDGVIPILRTSADGGSSFSAGATDYDWVTNGRGTAATSLDDDSAGDTSIKLVPSNAGSIQVGNAAGESFNGTITIKNPSNSSLKTIVEFSSTYIMETGGVGSLVGGGSRRAAAAVNGFRILLDTGNIASGTFKIYGVK